MTIRFAAPAVLAAITAFALAPVAHADDLMYRVGSDISPGDYTYTVVGGDLGSTARGDEGKPALAFSRKRHALIAPLSRASVEQMQEAIDSRRGREAPARPLAARCHGLM